MRDGASRAKKLLLGLALTILVLAALDAIAYWIEAVDPEYLAATGERIPKKDPGSFRVFVFGGSTVFGTPVPALGFVAQFEFWLGKAARQRPVEVYNFGVPSQTSSFVRRMVRASLRLDPDLIVVLTGHNEFLRPRMEGPLDRALSKLALTRVLVRLRNRLQAAIATRRSPRSDYRTFDPAAEPFLERVEGFQENLRGIQRLARESETPLVLIVPPANLAEWPPVGGEAMTLYEQGRASALEGRYEEAARLFDRARDLDPLPWRVLSEFNAFLRARSEERGVLVFDADRIFREAADHGLVGFSLVADNCHPTPRGSAILAGDLVRDLHREGWIDAAEFIPEDPQIRLQTFLGRTTSPQSRVELEREYLLQLAKYAMKTPFHNYGAARMYLERAVEGDPVDWRLPANLATLDLFEGRIDEGRRLLSRAAELKGSPIDPADRRNVPHLIEALEAGGVELDDLVPPRSP